MSDDNKVMFGKTSEVDTTPCPNCGAFLKFSPEQQTLQCDYCSAVVDFVTYKNKELAFENLLKQPQSWQDETHVFQCNMCGAKQVLPKNEMASSCSFCGTSAVVRLEEMAGEKPNAVIPFKISETESLSLVRQWASKKSFAPREFKRVAKPENVSGTYAPSFTFDTLGTMYYRGRIGTFYYTTRRTKHGASQVQNIRYRNISGVYTSAFDDILVQASSIIPKNVIGEIQPFKTNESFEYSSSFLQGYVAQINDKTGLECWEGATDSAKEFLQKEILKQYVYDVLDHFEGETTFVDITYKHVLLPVYVGHFRWKKKLYNFYINGETGKIFGKTPVSALRVSLLVTFILVVVVGILLFLWLS